MRLPRRCLRPGSSPVRDVERGIASDQIGDLLGSCRAKHERYEFVLHVITEVRIILGGNLHLVIER